MKKHLEYIVISVIVLFFISSPQIATAQCAMCKQAAETSMKSNPGSIARGLNSGILYLMAVPYLMIAFIFRKQLLKVFKLMKGKILKTSRS